MLLKMSWYIKSFSKTNYISFLIKYVVLLQNITKSRTKSVTVLSKNDLILNQSTTKYTQQQIENPEGKIVTNCHDDGMLEEAFYCICLWVLCWWSCL